MAANWPVSSLICAFVQPARRQSPGSAYFSRNLHSLRPLYAASAGLRSRVEATLLEGPTYIAPPGPAAWFRSTVSRALRVRTNFRWPMLQAVPALAILVALIAGAWIGRNLLSRSDPHSKFASMAARIHQQYLKGKLPLAMRSSSAAEIVDWVNGRVNFHFKLPSYAEIPTRQQPYRYEGARLISYQNNPAAYVAYRTADRSVSLIALPTSIAPPLRVRAVSMKSLMIYYDDVDGFHVITWSGPRSRLTYALVSDLRHSSQACIICHASSDPKDINLMQTLNQQ